MTWKKVKEHKFISFEELLQSKGLLPRAKLSRRKAIQNCIKETIAIVSAALDEKLTEVQVPLDLKQYNPSIYGSAHLELTNKGYKFLVADKGEQGLKNKYWLIDLSLPSKTKSRNRVSG